MLPLHSSFVFLAVCSDVLNLELILWSISVHLHEESLYPTSSKVSTSFAAVALRTVWASLSQSNWPTKVALTAFSVLASVSDLHSAIHAQNDTAVPEFMVSLTACIEANLKCVLRWPAPLSLPLRRSAACAASLLCADSFCVLRIPDRTA